jgi:hypothetical protein
MYYYTQLFLYTSSFLFPSYLCSGEATVICLQQIHTHQCDTSDDGIGTIFSDLVRFKVLTAVVMNSPSLWDIMLCSLLKINQHFGTCHLRLQDLRVSQARNQHEAVGKLVCCLFYCSTLKMEVTCSSKMSVYFQLTAQCYIPGVRTHLVK